MIRFADGQQTDFNYAIFPYFVNLKLTEANK